MGDLRRKGAQVGAPAQATMVATPAISALTPLIEGGSELIERGIQADIKEQVQAGQTKNLELFATDLQGINVDEFDVDAMLDRVDIPIERKAFAREELLRLKNQRDQGRIAEEMFRLRTEATMNKMRSEYSDYYQGAIKSATKDILGRDPSGNLTAILTSRAREISERHAEAVKGISKVSPFLQTAISRLPTPAAVESVVTDKNGFTGSNPNFDSTQIDESATWKKLIKYDHEQQLKAQKDGKEVKSALWMYGDSEEALAFRSNAIGNYFGYLDSNGQPIVDKNGRVIRDLVLAQERAGNQQIAVNFGAYEKQLRAMTTPQARATFHTKIGSAQASEVALQAQADQVRDLNKANSELNQADREALDDANQSVANRFVPQMRNSFNLDLTSMLVSTLDLSNTLNPQSPQGRQSMDDLKRQAQDVVTEKLNSYRQFLDRASEGNEFIANQVDNVMASLEKTANDYLDMFPDSQKVLKELETAKNILTTEMGLDELKSDNLIIKLGNQLGYGSVSALLNSVVSFGLQKKFSNRINKAFEELIDSPDFKGMTDVERRMFLIDQIQKELNDEDSTVSRETMDAGVAMLIDAVDTQKDNPDGVVKAIAAVSRGTGVDDIYAADNWIDLLPYYTNDAVIDNVLNYKKGNWSKIAGQGMINSAFNFISGTNGLASKLKNSPLVDGAVIFNTEQGKFLVNQPVIVNAHKPLDVTQVPQGYMTQKQALTQAEEYAKQLNDSIEIVQKLKGLDPLLSTLDNDQIAKLMYFGDDKIANTGALRKNSKGEVDSGNPMVAYTGKFITGSMFEEDTSLEQREEMTAQQAQLQLLTTQVQTLRQERDEARALSRAATQLTTPQQMLEFYQRGGTQEELEAILREEQENAKSNPPDVGYNDLPPEKKFIYDSIEGRMIVVDGRLIPADGAV